MIVDELRGPRGAPSEKRVSFGTKASFLSYNMYQVYYFVSHQSIELTYGARKRVNSKNASECESLVNYQRKNVSRGVVTRLKVLQKKHDSRRSCTLRAAHTPYYSAIRKFK